MNQTRSDDTNVETPLDLDLDPVTPGGPNPGHDVFNKTYLAVF